MKFNRRCFVFLFLPFIFNACKKKLVPTHTDIYFAGMIYKYSKVTAQGTPLETAVYWKNGVITQLTDSLSDARAEAVAVNGKDVYVVGHINDVATCWKNGVAKKICYGIIYAISVVGHDIYMAGVSGDHSWDIGAATYWKNGVPTIFGPGYILSMSVKDNNIYMTGFADYKKDKNVDVAAATYWKNNSRLPLNDTTDGSSHANGLYLDDGDVYIAGFLDNSVQHLPVYWKNGKIIDLALSKNHSEDEAESVFVQNGDVYVCGDVQNVPVYWKNGIQYQLSNSGGHTFANAIGVQGNNLYVAGDNQYYPVYWKNGTRIPLSKDKGIVYSMNMVSY